MGTVQHVDDGLLHSSGRNLSLLLSILGLVAQRGTPLGMDLRAPRDSFPSMECSDARTCRQGCQGERCETVFLCFATPPVAWQWRLESRLRRKHSVCLFRSRSRFVVGLPFLIAQFLCGLMRVFLFSCAGSRGQPSVPAGHTGCADGNDHKCAHRRHHWQAQGAAECIVSPSHRTCIF